ncbi:prepilin-type N-terminal cleavage/methylation domain-containing protein [Candidatus Gracilibacteria bacterium]|nr:prepilin-type N-terminal cleavage/methylation domain-containing protein [Candidatus Gracilibacteria bacterium]
MKSSISKNKKYGFTIVELIVVITLLAILGTIGFVSYVEYISSSRDSSRISQIQIINQAIEGNTRGRAPIPDDKVTIYANGVKIGYQGYAGENVLTEIGVNEGGKDPKDGTYYTYFVDSKQKYTQLLAFLENEEKTLTYRPLINQAKAVDYTERIAKTYGAKLGVLVEIDTKTPVQELSIVKAGGLDVVTTTGSYTLTSVGGYLSLIGCSNYNG